MPTGRRLRPAHLLGLVLVLPPLIKVGSLVWPTTRLPQVSAAAFAAGQTLFNHEWTPGDSLAGGDGIGPVFNARSCLECHSQGGGGGGGTVAHNVTVFGLSTTPVGRRADLPRVGVIHTHATRADFQETLDLVHPSLPHSKTIPLPQLIGPTRSGLPSGVTVTQRNTPALFGDGLLDAIPEDALHAEQRRNSALGRIIGVSHAVDPAIRGRVARLADGRLGRFGWKGEFATLDEFVRAACANELGLSNPSKPQAVSLAKAAPTTAQTDLTDAQCLLIGDYLRGLPRPVEEAPVDAAHQHAAAAGRTTFEAIGCADCHTPDLGPITGFYSNLLLHDMGAELASSTGYYGEPPAAPSEGTGSAPTPANEWRTPPLWGVADSAPYLHDGRAATLDDAIRAHRGEAAGVVTRYDALPRGQQEDVLAFLGTLRAPGAAGSGPPLAATSR